ncbi:MAG: hypothetical protein RLY14_293 [Planctomycetota bacterium]|jgi:hypothetical protein
MKSLCALILLTTFGCGLVSANELVSLPKDVPPVIGTAISANDSENWAVQLTIPRITWKIVGEQRSKIEWPELQVKVEETVLKLSMDYHPATQLSEESQNRLVDLNGRRLKRDEAVKRLKDKTPVLISVSGRMPDAFYLQCTKPDTLIVILGIPEFPAPQLLPHEITDHGRTKQ